MNNSDSYDARVCKLEAEGLTRSDAQGVIDLEDRRKLDQFKEYVWQCYGPGEMFGAFFDQSLTKPEANAACELRALSPDFDGDSLDRELVRDILLTSRGIKPQGLG